MNREERVVLYLIIYNFTYPQFPQTLNVSAKYYERCNLSNLDNTKKRQAFCTLEFIFSIKVINCQDFR